MLEYLARLAEFPAALAVWVGQWRERSYANLGGYFWASCERCGRGFGGHQWVAPLMDAMRVWDTDHSGHAAYCPACAAKRDEWDPGWRGRSGLRPGPIDPADLEHMKAARARHHAEDDRG